MTINDQGPVPGALKFSSCLLALLAFILLDFLLIVVSSNTIRSIAVSPRNIDTEINSVSTRLDVVESGLENANTKMVALEDELNSVSDAFVQLEKRSLTSEQLDRLRLEVARLSTELRKIRQGLSK